MTETTPRTDARNITGTMPQPGGPTPPTGAMQGYAGRAPTPFQISPSREAFQKTVMADIGRTEDTIAKTRERLGLPGMDKASFQERGLMIGGKVIAQNELDTALRLQKRVAGDFARAAGFKDKVSVNQAESFLNDKFNKMRLDLLRKGMEIDKMLAKRKASRAQRRSVAQNFGRAIGIGVGAYLGGFGGAAVGGNVGESAMRSL